MSSARTFILGAGAIGSLLAHELCLGAPHSIPPTLLFRNKARLNHFRQASAGGDNNDNADGVGELIVSHRYSKNPFTARSYLNLAVAPPLGHHHLLGIDNLIVTTKTYQTLQAIEPYLPSLSPDANIIILQNGMGMASKLEERFWSSSSLKPNFFEAITTHGAFKSAPNVVQHAAEGKIILLRYLGDGDPMESSQSIPPIITQILDCPRLHASFADRNTFLTAQMEKLIVNSCINPLTAIYDCLNGDLLLGSTTSMLMRKIISEASLCLQAEFPHLSQSVELRNALHRDRLAELALSVCKATAKNSSSMREDMRHLNTTEISSFNGYIASLGDKYDIRTPGNTMIVQLVKGKLSILRAVEENAATSIVEEMD